MVKETLLATDDSDTHLQSMSLKMISSMDEEALAENDLVDVTVEVLTQQCFNEHTRRATMKVMTEN